jgi:predicted ArsR family transcriptional regulator
MQGILFDPPRARRTDPDTSHAAASRLNEFANAQCQKIASVLATKGDLGAEQIGDILAIDAYAIRKRLADLEHRGAAWPLALVRKTRSGRSERIWTVKSPRDPESKT